MIKLFEYLNDGFIIDNVLQDEQQPCKNDATFQ